MANENAKKTLHFVLQAYVTASANTDDSHIRVRDVEEIINESNVYFTVNKQDPKNKSKTIEVPMTDRAKKLCIGKSVSQYEKVLLDRGATEKQVATKIKKLNLKPIKDAPKMTKDPNFEFEEWEKELQAIAQGN